MRKQLIVAAAAVVTVAGIGTAYAVTESSGSNTRTATPVAATIPATGGAGPTAAPTTAGPAGTTAASATASSATPRVILRQGPAGGNAFWYAVELHDFAPNTAYTVSCYQGDPGTARAFSTFTTRTDSDGAGFRDDGCHSADPEQHWVRVGAYRSAFVTWLRAPVKAPPPATDLPPRRPPTTGKPLRPTGPVTPPPPITVAPPEEQAEPAEQAEPEGKKEPEAKGRPADT